MRVLTIVLGHRETQQYQAAETLALAGVALITEVFEVTQAEYVCHYERVTPSNLQRYLLSISLYCSKA